MDHNLQERVFSMCLVRVNIRVDDVVTEFEVIVAGLEQGTGLVGRDKVVLMSGIVSPVLLELVIDISLRLSLAELDVAGLDTEHERNTDHDSKHEHVHQSNLVIVAALVSEQGGLMGS